MSGVEVLVLQILGALGFLGGLAALMTAFFSRPKIRAEAVKIATETTTEIIGNLRAEIADVRQQNLELKETVDRLEQQEDESAQKLREQVSALWDCVQFIRRVVALLTSEQRAQLGDPPDVERFFR